LLFKEKLKGVLATGWYILGNEVKEFETRFAKWDTILHWYRKWSGCSGFDF
jgi:dTDP-4-amino-4,6-dideoxygalactose transaminase